MSFLKDSLVEYTRVAVLNSIDDNYVNYSVLSKNTWIILVAYVSYLLTFKTNFSLITLKIYRYI